MAPQAEPGVAVFITYTHSVSAGKALPSLRACGLSAMTEPSMDPKHIV
jgi:hypothetical protein